MSEPIKPSKSPFILLVMLGILVVATLVIASSYFLRPSIELELKNKLANQFANTKLSSAIINVSGRDVTLNGSVKSKAEAEQAENTAKKIWGIREVNNQLLIKSSTTE